MIHPFFFEPHNNLNEIWFVYYFILFYIILYYIILLYYIIIYYIVLYYIYYIISYYIIFLLKFKMFIGLIRIKMLICIHTCAYLHACMHAYMHTCIHTYIVKKRRNSIKIVYSYKPGSSVSSSVFCSCFLNAQILKVYIPALPSLSIHIYIRKV